MHIWSKQFSCLWIKLFYNLILVPYISATHRSNCLFSLNKLIVFKGFSTYLSVLLDLALTFFLKNFAFSVNFTREGAKIAVFDFFITEFAIAAPFLGRSVASEESTGWGDSWFRSCRCFWFSGCFSFRCNCINFFRVFFSILLKEIKHSTCTILNYFSDYISYFQF